MDDSLPDREQLKHIKDLKNDGSTACGAWIYCGVFPEKGHNRAIERNPKDRSGSWLGICLAERLPHHLQPRLGAARWTTVERAQETGVVGRSKKAMDAASTSLITTKKCRPILLTIFDEGQGVDALGGAKPFTLHPDGVGWLYVSSGLKDGPLPTHYEPLESVSKESAVRPANESCRK